MTAFFAVELRIAHQCSYLCLAKMFGEGGSCSPPSDSDNPFYLVGTPPVDEMTDAQFQQYNAWVEARYSRARARERRAEEMEASCMLKRLAMPEDVAIQRERRYTPGELKGFFSENRDTYEYDPVARPRKLGARLRVFKPPKRRWDERLETYRARSDALQAVVDRHNAHALASASGTSPQEDGGPAIKVPRGGL